MGTAKRERQKANRQTKIEQLAKEVKVQQRKRKGLRLGLLAGGVLAAAVILWALNRKDDEVAEPQGSTPEAAVVDSSVPSSVDPSASVVLTSDTSVDPAASVPPVVDTTPASTVAAGPFQYGTTECPPAEGAAAQTQKFDAPFKQCIDPAKTYTAEVETNQGSFTITLDPKKAPGTVNSFVSLARNKYFENVICHRVVKDFVVQCGDPTGTGSGGPGYEFADELPQQGEYKIGSIAMANAGPGTNGSQFFIITGANGAALPPSYSLFGEVTAGQDIAVTKLNGLSGAGDGPPTTEIKILKVTITEK